jgi:hypothetical protein
MSRVALQAQNQKTYKNRVRTEVFVLHAEVQHEVIIGLIHGALGS